ncbi:isopeptide-forming domain-containing fimbrial protein [Leuconostoc holzapfelii]|uniref:Isopeptide-forming domain-containing fimbrial protein n=1 Tax=Leuconostoc holzapfelii TaxID=434464 RepID=A0ABT2NT90_9LACO|nr:SpaH/EbpB family LPXTG-anchored major pilin [Leuconostoc holzapfelii]MCT8388602.1 isopeptide-forming domain-containing fimbrial protein [Leuconostoc holzapfelii]
MKSSIWSKLAHIGLLLPILIATVFSAMPVFADTTPNTVNVTLHKRVFDTGQVPAAKENSGVVDNDFGGAPLANVTFTAYDVTAQYLRLRQAGQTAQNAVATVQHDALTTVPSYATKLSDGTTGNDGNVTFANLAAKDGDKDKVYLFLETNSPMNITQPATPVVLALPVYQPGSDSQVNTDIHVYPKNEQTSAISKDLTTQSKSDLTVKLPDGKSVYNATIGQTFSYQLQVAVPWNIQDKSTFTVVDTPKLGIDDIASTVKINGLEQGTDYQVSATDATTKDGKGFRITFNPKTDRVKAMAGKKLIVTYDATLTKFAVPENELTNAATLTIDHDVATATSGDGVGIFTGGASFVKVDKQSQAKLAGAVFQLVKLDSQGNIVSYANQAADGSYQWGTSANKATVFTTDSQGMLKLQGLTYSAKLPNNQRYALLETQAPTGYARLAKPLAFNVTKGSYANDQTISIENTKKGLLPATGGAGIYVFLGLGLVLMAGAAWWYKKHQVA